MVVKSKCEKEIRDWFASQWNDILVQYSVEYEAGELKRMEKMFDNLKGKAGVVFEHRLQRPYTFFLPELPTQMFFDASTFQLAQELESNYEMIKEELLELYKQEESPDSFQEYIGDGVNSDKNGMTNKGGDWKVFYFWKQFQEITNNTSRCPQTFKLLQKLKEKNLILSGMVCFSSLLPGTHIIPHTGPSNMRLTCHLGLIGCNNIDIRVGDQTSTFINGKCIIFDDSFLHDVLHNGQERRVTLMLDMWHPEMNETEVKVFMQVMKNSSTFMHPDEFFHSLKLFSTK